MDYNLKSVFLACKHVIPVMIAQGGGAIVNIASTSGTALDRLAQVGYAASKAGVMQLSRVVAVQYANKGIRVNTVVPGQLHTPMVEARLAGQRAGGDVEKLAQDAGGAHPGGLHGRRPRHRLRGAVPCVGRGALRHRHRDHRRRRNGGAVRLARSYDGLSAAKPIIAQTWAMGFGLRPQPILRRGNDVIRSQPLGPEPTCPPPDPIRRGRATRCRRCRATAHFHIFGPAQQFPYAPSRTFTPHDAPKDRLFGLHKLLGFERGVFVQSSCHGTDHAAVLDALKDANGRYRGVALLAPETPKDEVARLDAAGFCGVRFHFLPHLGNAPSYDAMRAVMG